MHTSCMTERALANSKVNIFHLKELYMYSSMCAQRTITKPGILNEIYASEIKVDHNTYCHMLFSLLLQDCLLSYLIHKTT